MATSRKVARKALAALLETALVGVGLPVKTVSDSKTVDLAGITPLVGVLSRGSNRVGLTFEGNRAVFEFVVQVWVLRSAEGWTLANAEDALDDIEAIIAEVCETNNRTSDWDTLEYTEPTMVIEVTIGNVPYFLENISVKVLLGRN